MPNNSSPSNLPVKIAGGIRYSMMARQKQSAGDGQADDDDQYFDDGHYWVCDQVSTIVKV